VEILFALFEFYPQRSALSLAAGTRILCFHLFRSEKRALSSSRWCPKKSKTPRRQPPESWRVTYCLTWLDVSQLEVDCLT